MYSPAHFSETRPEVLADAIRNHPLAALVTITSSGLDANHIPLLYFPEESVLRGHMARGNQQWREYLSGSEALAIFSGSENYISPSWYEAKTEHGKVVPTWNYVIVHARGPLTTHEEPEWLLENVTALTEAQEAQFEQPWRVSDAPDEYIQGLLRGIVGIEMHVKKLEGKWKTSQNRTGADRERVANTLEEMARLVRKK